MNRQERIIELIVSEIDWHRMINAVKDTPSKDYRDGFLVGLYHIKRLIEQMPEDE